MLNVRPFAALALAGLLIACETPAPSVPPGLAPDTAEAAALGLVSDTVRAQTDSTSADSTEALRGRLRWRLNVVLDGRGPLRLSRVEMYRLVDSLTAGPYADLWGVWGPNVDRATDLNGDRRPDRFLYTTSDWGAEGAAYVQQVSGGYKLVGRLNLGGGFAVCPARGGAEVHVTSGFGFLEDGTFVNRAGGAYGARLWVTADTALVRETFSIGGHEYLEEMNDAERAAAWRRLNRFAERAGPRPGCVTSTEFDG